MKKISYLSLGEVGREGRERSAELGNILSEPKIPSLTVTCVLSGGQVQPARLVISLLSPLPAQTSHRRRRFRSW